MYHVSRKTMHDWQVFYFATSALTDCVKSFSEAKNSSGIYTASQYNMFTSALWMRFRNGLASDQRSSCRGTSLLNLMLGAAAEISDLPRKGLKGFKLLVERKTYCEITEDPEARKFKEASNTAQNQHNINRIVRVKDSENTVDCRLKKSKKTNQGCKQSN